MLMEKINVTLCGIAITDTKDIGTNLSRFELLVLSAVVHGCNDVRKTLPKPVRISIDVIGQAKMPQNLPTPGTEVEVRIVGEPYNFKAEVVSVTKQSRSSIKSLIQSLQA